MIILSNSKPVIQIDSSRVISRDTTRIDYTQLSMTDLVDLPLTLSSRPLSEAKEPRSVAVAGRPFTTEASYWSRGLLQAEEAVREALAASARDMLALAEPGPCHDSALRHRAIDRASRRLVAAWVCGVLLGDLDRGSSLLDAERWFTDYLYRHSGDARGTVEASTGGPCRGREP